MHKRKIGIVVSDKMDKTVVVKITNYRKHPLYKKYVRKSTKIYAHDEKKNSNAGV